MESVIALNSHKSIDGFILYSSTLTTTTQHNNNSNKPILRDKLGTMEVLLSVLAVRNSSKQKHNSANCPPLTQLYIQIW